MKEHRKKIIIIIGLIALVVLASWYLIPQLTRKVNGSLKASGTVETVEVLISPELAGQVNEVLVNKGDIVKPGDALFKLDAKILQAQLDQAKGVLESATAGVKVAATGVEAAKSGLLLAQASLDLAKTQYQLTNETIRGADFRNRSKSWREDVLYEFSLPVWYFQSSERILAAEAEVENAKIALEKERQDFQEILEKTGNGALIEAEERLARARFAFEVADEVYDRAVAQNDDDGDTNDEDSDDDDEDNTVSHVQEQGFEAAEDALENAAEAAHKKAKDELYAAQDEYKDLLGLANTKVIREARARLTVAIERYELAQDEFSKMFTGAESLQLLTAEYIVKQAQASLAQSEVAVTQAEAKYEQALATLQQAQGQVDLVTVQIAKLTVYARVNGVVLTRGIEPGEVMQPGSAAMTLGDLEQLTITVYVSEDRYGQIELGQIAHVMADSFPGQSFEATVTHIANKAEFTPRNVQTEEGRRTTVFAVELSITDPENKLKPGMPVDVEF